MGAKDILIDIDGLAAAEAPWVDLNCSKPQKKLKIFNDVHNSEDLL